MIGKGYIIFVSAGNEYENACKEDRKEFSYGLYNGSISVGAATFNIEHNRYDGIFKFWWVANVVTSIVSEHPEIKFTQEWKRL